MINWFPGHMAQARRLINDNIKYTDAVIYMLDARAPFSCINPSFSPVIRGKGVVYALNKADLVPTADVKAWCNKLSGENVTALSLTGTDISSARKLVEGVRSVCAEKIARRAAKGMNAILRALVIGVPNTGKSTVINSLAGKYKLETGNRPGVTRSIRWIKINDYLEIADTPGTLYPKLENQRTARHLAYIGSIKNEILDVNELAADLIAELNEKEPRSLITRYGELDFSSPDILEQIALARGFKMRGDIADVDRAAAAVLDDFRKGRMGKIILEKAD